MLTIDLELRVSYTAVGGHGLDIFGQRASVTKPVKGGDSKYRATELPDATYRAMAPGRYLRCQSWIDDGLPSL
jgi:hypothetical protein